MRSFDIIGDIHGHAYELVQLLNKMGYQLNDREVFYHPEGRKVLFVGDYIDRGPFITDTLKIVRSMTDENHAIALMGNHELNAVLFNLKRKGGGYGRAHTIKNFRQHQATIMQFHNRQDAYDNYIQWFKNLPLYYEDEDIRAIHACWDPALIDELENYLKDDNSLIEKYWPAAGSKGEKLYHLLDDLLKGKEVKLPNGLTFEDKDGNKREDMRIEWWTNPATLETWDDWSVKKGISGLKTTKLPEEYRGKDYYRASEKPVFFGHYWLKGTPQLASHNACCLDYSVAKGGNLVAYRYDGEEQLDPKKLVVI